MNEPNEVQTLINSIIGFGICTLGFGWLGYLYYIRPDIVDRPLDGWWGRYTKAPPEEKPKRLSVYKKAGVMNFFMAAIFLLITVSRLYELLAKIP